MHENLCLQLEVDSKSFELEKLKQQISRSDTHNSLQYVNSKTRSLNSSERKEKKVVRIDSHTTIIRQNSESGSSEKSSSEPITKIYERKKTSDVPTITELLSSEQKSSVAPHSTSSKTSSSSSSHYTLKSTKESMALMQVSSNASAVFSSENGSEPIRTQSAPEIVQSSIFSDSCKSCESLHVKIKN